MTNLQRLIEAVECGGDIYPSNFPKDFKGKQWAIRAHEGSLDAAKALHDALLPGWRFEVRVSNAEVWSSYKLAFSAEVIDNPARAWLLAILKAYQAQQDAN